ncbi:MAG TPA: pilus assembly protein TadG-related protein [Candidatus Deferrimicrobium sp.]|nr:pilus assembly protein TadG-related protein [Candidatus Deferrimicrobium sp.]
MSSTTERRRREGGQIIVIFAGALIAICAIAALVFDVGQNLLDRRAEQNAADAAALAGARYVIGVTYTYHGGCGAGPFTSMPAVQTACDIAAANGYVDGANGRIVRVDLPPIAPSVFSGRPGHIEVTIRSTRGSFFQGVLGVTQQKTAADAVATNGSDIPLPYSLLALDPTGCGTNKINGAPGTIVTTDGTVHVDSACPTDALLLSGNGVLTAPECDVVGTIQTANNATNNCTEAPTGVLVSGDPLRFLPPPTKPGPPTAVLPLDATPGPIPANCPGGSAPATDSAPAPCAFTAPAMNSKTYRIFPGNYPGGIQVTRATVYMDPGLYYIGGGGIDIKSTGPAGVYGQLVSKAPGDNTGIIPSGGVLIYDTKDPVTGTIGPIHLNGGDGSTLALEPIQSGLYKNMVIFVDRDYPTGTVAIDLNGDGSNLAVSGTIYAASGTVKLNGGASSSISAQVICYNFQVNGSGSSFTIDFNPDELFHVKGVGLVQ